MAAIPNACPDKQFLYVVFNRAAKEEAQRLMPRNVNVRTVHPIAYAAVGRAFQSRLTTERWAWLTYLREQMPEVLRSVATSGRDEFSAGALIRLTLEQFLRTTDAAVLPKHTPCWCDGALASITSAAAGALWERVRNLKGHAPVTHDSYLKLFFLNGGRLAGKNQTVMLDEAQDADPVILALVERHQGARVLVGDPSQQLYQWRGAINALLYARADAVLPLTQTFRFGAETAVWANQILEALGEARRIVAASHTTTVSVENNSDQAEFVLARSNAGILGEAVRALDRRRRVHVMGGVDARRRSWPWTT